MLMRFMTRSTSLMSVAGQIVVCQRQAEWELAASGSPNDINAKRFYPWGDDTPTENTST